MASAVSMICGVGRASAQSSPGTGATSSSGSTEGRGQRVFLAELALDFTGFAGQLAALDGELFALIGAGELRGLRYFSRPDAGQRNEPADERDGMDARHHDQAGHIEEGRRMPEPMAPSAL